MHFGCSHAEITTPEKERLYIALALILSRQFFVLSTSEIPSAKVFYVIYIIFTYSCLNYSVFLNIYTPFQKMTANYLVSD